MLAILCALAWLLTAGGSVSQAKRVVLGFRTDIQPFSFQAQVKDKVKDKANAANPDKPMPYLGFVADLCYEIFDNSGYDIVQVPVEATKRFPVMRRPPGEKRMERANGEEVDVLCDATTVRLDDKERIEAGVFSPIIFVSGISYLSRSIRNFEDIEVGYVENSTAERVAKEACTVDVLRVSTKDTTAICRIQKDRECILERLPFDPKAPRRESLSLSERAQQVPDYVLCPKPDHDALIQWFCSDNGHDKIYFGDRDIILAKLMDWQTRGHPCKGYRDAGRSFTYEPYALLISKADPELIAFVQRRVYELFSHRAGAEALFNKWFPGQSMSEPLAWLFVLNGVAEQGELLSGPKEYFIETPPEPNQQPAK
ncbi:hypothetical protein [Kaistia granuli]|uniref:hypothetical protein n=1 Tax=Kaistia granuli TaxID=363259 RepID=UPI0003770E8E|nr:hypothetical protein [Kaistia granuli]